MGGVLLPILSSSDALRCGVNVSEGSVRAKWMGARSIAVRLRVGELGGNWGLVTGRKREACPFFFKKKNVSSLSSVSVSVLPSARWGRLLT